MEYKQTINRTMPLKFEADCFANFVYRSVSVLVS